MQHDTACDASAGHGHATGSEEQWPAQNSDLLQRALGNVEDVADDGGDGQRRNGQHGERPCLLRRNVVDVLAKRYRPASATQAPRTLAGAVLILVVARSLDKRGAVVRHHERECLAGLNGAHGHQDEDQPRLFHESDDNTET